MPDNSAKHRHVSMCPGLIQIFRENSSLEKVCPCSRCRNKSRKRDRKATLLQEKLEPTHRIRMVFAHEFEPIVKCDDDCSIRFRTQSLLRHFDFIGVWSSFR